MSEDKKIKVKAVRLGFFDFEKKQEGAVFFIKESAFSEKWMEKLEKKEAPAPKAKAKGKGKGPSKDDEVI